MITEAMASGATSEDIERLEQLKRDSEYSFGKSLVTAAEEAVPFAAQVLHPETFSLNYKKEDINWEDKDINKLVKSVPNRYYPSLFESRNVDQLKATVAGIKNSLGNAAYMNEQHGFATSMGLYALGSVFDPLSWSVYGGATKLAGAWKFMESASTAKKAGYWGATGAVTEGGSEGIIQSYGAQEYENVPIAAGFGLALAGGASAAHSLLSNAHIVNKQKAIDELNEATPDTSTKEGLEKTQELVNIINEETSAIRPVKNFVFNAVDTLTGKKINALRSPTFQLWNMGGKGSKFGSLIDTPVGVSKDKDGNIIEHADTTVMDVKYDIAKDMLDMEVTRIKAVTESGMGEEAFTRAVWENTQKLRQEYVSRVQTKIDEIKKNKEEIDAERTKAKEEYEKLEDKGDITLNEFQDKHIESFARKKAIDEVEEIEINTGNKAIDDMLRASNKYYESMHKRMVDAGIEGADEMLPKHYSPIVYDTKAIKMHDTADVEDAFTQAIEESRAYKEELERAKIKIEEVKASLKEQKTEADALDKLKEIAELNDYIEQIDGVLSGRYLFSKGTSDLAAKLDFFDLDEDAMQYHYPEKFELDRDMSDFISPINEEHRQVLDEVIQDSDVIKELLDLSGLTKDSFFVDNLSGYSYNSILNKVKFFQSSKKPNKAELTNAIEHELIHAISSRRINSSEELADELIDIAHEISTRKDELLDLISEEIDVDTPFFTQDISYDSKVLTIRDRVNYMLSEQGGVFEGLYDVPKNPHELLAVATSNPYIARALNKMKASTKIDGKQVKSRTISIFKKLLNLLKKSLGIKRLNKDSVFYDIITTIDKYSKENPLRNTVTAKIRKDISTLNKYSQEHYQLQIKKQHKISEKEDVAGDDMTGWGDEPTIIQRDNKVTLTAKEKEREAFLEKEMDKLSTRILKSRDKEVAKINKTKEKLKEIEKETEAKLSNAKKDYRRLLQYPKKAAKGTVESIKAQKNMSGLNFEDINPARLKGRKLPIDVNHPALENYVVKNEAALAQMYNYTMGGRISTKQVLGFDKPTEMRRYLEDEIGMNPEEVRVSMDAFELALGSKQIPSDPDNGWEKASRIMSQFNYVTMGGQFGRTALSEIGVGVHRLGFSYIKELFPAIGDVIKMYRGKDLDKIKQDMVILGDANAIYQNKSHSAFADTTYIESTLAHGLEAGMKKASTKMFRWSGLEAITVITQMVIPRQFLARIIKEADRPTAQLDMIRWGLSIEDMRAIKKQPIKYDESGTIVDFNLEAWNPKLAEKFKKVTIRMSRDTIMRPDAVRVPTWLNDGNTNIMFKLAKQFMTFSFLSHERLLLNGLNERQASAVVGSVISASILYMYAMAAEEAGVALGIIDEDDRKYNTEEGQTKLAAKVASMNSYAGGLGILAETINNMGTPWGEEQLVTKFAGGPTGSRAFQMYRAAEDTMSGKKGTYSQVNMLKSMVPYNNLIGLDNFFKDVAGDIVEEQRKHGYK